VFLPTYAKAKKICGRPRGVRIDEPHLRGFPCVWTVGRYHPLGPSRCARRLCSLLNERCRNVSAEHESELSAGRPAEGLSYLAELESKCGEDYAAHQSGHWLSDRDGFHARVDGRVYSARPVRGRAHSFGYRDVSTVRRRIS
jgi:hypothetical protein